MDKKTKITIFITVFSKNCIMIEFPQGDKNHFQIGPYVPNMTFVSISVSSKRNKLKPKEKMVFTILYILSKDLESIRPFAISNYEDYFEEK